MVNSPELVPGVDSNTFLEHYYLKEELVEFCRKNGLPVSGGKQDITDRIVQFLNTGEVMKSAAVHRKAVKTEVALTEEDLIEENFVCTEKHRAFFTKYIGQSFSFNVIFQKWLKSNSGKSYRDAISAYNQIMEEKKKKKTTIDKQFEYNTYIRDFFEDNKGMSLNDAIKCWKYKKLLPGSHRYEM